MGLRFKNSYLCFEGRDDPPLHYTLKLKSISNLVESSIHKIISNEFEVGKYKWKLHISLPNEYSNWNYICMNIELVNPNLQTPWEFYAVINFFVLDQKRFKYYTLQDSRVVRFHSLHRIWGISKFLDLHTFNDSTNGYLVDDMCEFGVEVMIKRQSAKVDVFSFSDKIQNTYTLKMKYDLEPYGTLFTCGNFQWMLYLYSKVSEDGKLKGVLFDLYSKRSTLCYKAKVYLHCKIFLFDLNGSNLDEIGGFGYFSETTQSCNFEKPNLFGDPNDPKPIVVMDLVDPNPIGDEISCVLEAHLPS